MRLDDAELDATVDDVVHEGQYQCQADRLGLDALDDANIAGTDRPALPVPSDDPMARILAENLPYSESRRQLLAEFERRYVEDVLAAHDGNVVRAAAAAGLAKRYFQFVRARRR
jgi:DNA-binding NtrC family response regulator